MTSKYSAYPAYKDSGVESIGDIPDGWKSMKLKFLGEALIGITYSPSEIVNESSGILVFRSSNVQSGKIDYEDCVYVDKEIRERQLTQAGDILICSRNGSINLIGKNALIDKSSAGVTFGAFMTIFRSPNFIFLRYFFNSQNFKNQSGLFSTSTINQLTTGVLNNIFAPIPKSIVEQQQIAHFLDDKTAHLDKLIGQKQQMIGLLNEKRMALITQAVTRGLDLTVPMKDSGVEWLGDVPVHWSIRRFRFFLRDGYDSLKIGPFGSQIKSTELINQGYKIYGQENVINKNFVLGNRFIDDDKFNELLVYEILPNDMLITMMGTSGRCEIFPTGIEQGIMDSHLIRIRLNEEIIPKFAQILIDESSYVSHQLNLLGKGSIMHGLNSSVIKNIKFLLPPIKEQESIISFLDTETQKIDDMIKTVKQAIATLQEYRTALITAAVTGKVDVRSFITATH